MSKICRLEIKNFIGIEELAVELKDINKITGGNGKGKTTILDSIQKAIFNSCNPRPEIIRNGEESARIFVELDNGITIERTMKNDGADKVKVLDNGQPVSKPETFLRKLLGKHIFSFNPVDFIQKSDKEQAEILLSLLPIMVSKEDVKSWLVDDYLYPNGMDININYNQHGLRVCKELASKHNGILYDKRAVVNKEVALYEDEISSIKRTLPDNYKLEEWQNESLKSIQEKINEANKVNSFIQEANNLVQNNDTKIESIKNSYELKKNKLLTSSDNQCARADRELEEAISKLDKEIEMLKKKIESLEVEKSKERLNSKNKISNIVKLTEKDLLLLVEQEKKELEEISTRVERATKYLDENKKIDIEPLNKQFDETEKMRSYIPLAEKLEKLKETWEQKRKEAECLDRFVEIARSKPNELLSKVKLPVDGLSITDDGIITINGLPIRNLSTSEQLKVALDIARTTCNDLKLISIDRFESLDSDAQEEFYKQIKDDGYQYCVTIVTEKDMRVVSE